MKALAIRTTAALLVLVFLFGVSGCGSSNEEETETEENGTVEEQETEAEAIEEEESAEEEEETEADSEYTIYDSGQYKVGSDIPAGEYVLFADGYSGYFEVTTDSSGELDSIIVNDNFYTNSIVTINEGEYFQMTGCYAIPIEENPPVDTTDEGMFKVGLHIEPGEYKVTVDESAVLGYGYVEVSSDSSHKLTSIVSNDNFEGSRYITVTSGQYLTLSSCTMEQVESTGSVDDSSTEETAEETAASDDSVAEDLDVLDLAAMLGQDITYVETNYPEYELLADNEEKLAYYIESCSYYGRNMKLLFALDSSGLIGYIGMIETQIDDLAEAMTYTQSVIDEVTAVYGEATSIPDYTIAYSYAAGDEYYAAYWLISDTYIETSLYFDYEDEGTEILSGFASLSYLEEIGMDYSL